jgi:DNA-binding transcriptional MerR regulator/methylmalonyl-CoA mutase cobalamin-binding subunit
MADASDGGRNGDAGTGHPMAVVARRTGLHPDVLRAWERRYAVVKPLRSPGNRRLYSESDVRRLELIVRALRLGWPIGQVASRTDAELRQLVAGAPAAEPEHAPAREPAAPAVGAEATVERCLAAIASLDAERLRAELDDALVALGRVPLIDRVLAPLLTRVGERYERGQLRIAGEHLASAVVARVVDRLHAAAPASDAAPSIVVTTPAFQHHELGAQLVAACARIEGWRAIYLGPNLPAEEIAAAARLRGARAVAVSLSYPPSHPSTDAELRRLGDHLRGHAAILAGGASADSYGDALAAAGAERMTDLAALRAWLARHGSR